MGERQGPPSSSSLPRSVNEYITIVELGDAVTA
jgi:hypothetical protein